jgi:hypothetical protein
MGFETQIFQIWNGRTINTAIPRSCGTRQRFIETIPNQEIGSGPLGLRGSPHSEVTKAGDRFIVTKSGRRIDEFVVRNGYVVEAIAEPMTFQGHKVPRAAEIYSDFSRAPRIAIPRADDVVTGLPILLHGCPIERSPN